LPVVDEGRVVGLVSDRDITWVRSVYHDTETKVHEAMTERPYVVTGDAPLADVARHMSAHRFGSAVVMADAQVEGIFTTVDACRALADLLTASS
jgi:CBS domain-containing protein